MNEYDITRPLGDKLEEYMAIDLFNICNELVIHGIVYESQYKKLSSMVCKKNATELMEIFRQKTRKEILYGYDNVTCNFFFYDMEKYKLDDAIRLSISFQNCIQI